VTDLDGRRPEAIRGKQLDSSAIREIEAPASSPLDPTWRSYRSAGRFSVRCRNESSSGDERWFYVREEGLLRGYDGLSKRLIGSCGPDGFIPAGQEPRQRFRGDAYHGTFLYEAGNAYFLSLADGVYALDFARHSVRRLFTPAAGQTVLAAARWKDERARWSRAFVLTDRAVHVLDEAGTPLFSAPLAYDREDYGRVSVAQLEDPGRFAVMYQPSWYLSIGVGKTMPSYLVEYDAEGREVARRTVPPRPLNGPPRGLALFGLTTSPAEAAVVAGATRESVAAGRRTQGLEVQPVAFFVAVPTQLFIPGAGPDMDATGGVVTAYQALILLSALACAAICFLLARRNSLSRAGRVGWALCGLLLGPAGLLLMLALRPWPVRVNCPACRRPRVVTRDTCEHCGAEHALPTADGTEVLEPELTTLDIALAGHAVRHDQQAEASLAKE
jgi:hypothetical protein